MANSFDPRPCVTIVCPTLGLGLKKDATIIKQALDANGLCAKVLLVDMSGRPRSLLKRIFTKILLVRDKLAVLLGMRSQHISIHVEQILFRFKFRSPTNVFIPNQEWCDARQLAHLGSIQEVWCKSRLSENLFSELGVPTRYIGFNSQTSSVPDSSAERKREFLTRIGVTKTRGADQLASLWSRHPEWPTLHMIVDPRVRPSVIAGNLNYIDPILDDRVYSEFTRSILFHVFVTEAEGWGHTILESMTEGAVVLVTDAPPMNEYADSTSAILIPADYAGRLMLSPRFKAQDSDIEDAVNAALTLSKEDSAAMRRRASLVNDALRTNFARSIAAAVRQVAGDKLDA